jgi:hypothetical protein
VSASERPESLLGIAARDLERLGQVTATLVRHGFGALIGRGAAPAEDGEQHARRPLHTGPPAAPDPAPEALSPG